MLSWLTLYNAQFDGSIFPDFFSLHGLSEPSGELCSQESNTASISNVVEVSVVF